MSDDPKQEQLSGYQVQQIRLAVQSEVQRIIKDVELRKWCVEQAITSGCGKDQVLFTDPITGQQSFVNYPVPTSAAALYAFVTAAIPKEPSDE